MLVHALRLSPEEHMELRALQGEPRQAREAELRKQRPDRSHHEQALHAC
ncbi:MAG: hypothetical protein R3E96_13190 [Planctomycetota bacterium]